MVRLLASLRCGLGFIPIIIIIIAVKTLWMPRSKARLLGGVSGSQPYDEDLNLYSKNKIKPELLRYCTPYKILAYEIGIKPLVTRALKSFLILSVYMNLRCETTVQHRILTDQAK